MNEESFAYNRRLCFGWVSAVNFQLIAAMNPCPCGFYLDPQKACGCAPAVVTKYQKHISSPILDRIDIHIKVPGLEYEKLTDDRLGETSASIRQRCKWQRYMASAICQQRFIHYLVQCQYVLWRDQAVLHIAE